LFTFPSHFAAIHHDYYYEFMTTRTLDLDNGDPSCDDSTCARWVFSRNFNSDPTPQRFDGHQEMSALSRTVDAQANLQQQFDRHRCQPEDAS